MGVSGHLIDVRGVTIIGVPPFDVAQFSFENPVSVLYGKNGAGKTRLMSIVRDALLGAKPDGGTVYLHVRIAAQGLGRLYGAITTAMGIALDEETQLTRDAREDADIDYRFLSFRENVIDLLEGHAYVRELRDLGQPGITQLLERYSAIRKLDDRVDDVADGAFVPQLPGNPSIVLEPRGTTDSPEWRMYAAAPMDDHAFRDDFLARLTSREQRGGLFANASESGFDGEDYALLRWWPAEAPAPSADRWPEWAGVPVFDLGDLRGVANLGVRIVDFGDLTDADISDRTIDLFQHFPGPLAGALDDGHVEYTAEVVAAVDEVQRRATQIVQSLLTTAPRLALQLTHPNDWLRGRVPWWAGEVADETLPLSSLSWTEQRWSRAAIALALAERTAGVPPRPSEPERRDPPRYGVLLPEISEATLNALDQFTRMVEGSLDGAASTLALLDEPERGVHRSLEVQLPDVLRSISAPGNVVVAASHAPSVLTDSTITQIHVVRDPLSRRSELAEIGPTRRGDLELAAAHLGVTPGDLFLLSRTVVLVEGAHDVAVLQGLLPDTFGHPFVRVLRLGGAKRLAGATQIQLLWDYTDAHIVVVLDNASEAQKRWDEFSTASAASEMSRARAAIAGLRALPGGEAGWLADLADEVEHRGYTGRVTVVGLSMPDIICYLPPEPFTAGAEHEWSDVIAKWRPPGQRAHDIKRWITATYGVTIGRRLIERVAAGLDGEALHPDLAALELVVRDSLTIR